MHPHAIRAAALRQPWSVSPLVGAVALGGGVLVGYLLGRWLKSKPPVVGADENRYLVGAQVLGGVRLTGIDAMCLPR